MMEKSKTEITRAEINEAEARRITDGLTENYLYWLHQNERSRGTIQKYHYYLKEFQTFAGESAVSKELVLGWKEELKKQWAPVTVNGALAAVNGLFRFAGWEDCVVRLLRIRRQVFCSRQKELSKQEYTSLVEAAIAEGDQRMALLLQTVCSTGIRISELNFITVEALEVKCAEVDCKGKVRRILLPEGLCRLLKAYAKEKGLTHGMVFVTRTGRAMDRSNIWRAMKRLASIAGVSEEKVFPHNLRHLFAREYYRQEKDLLRLSDVLGHSNINTTRIYTMESGEQHVRQLERLNLLIGKEYNGISLLL